MISLWRGGGGGSAEKWPKVMGGGGGVFFDVILNDVIYEQPLKHWFSCENMVVTYLQIDFPPVKFVCDKKEGISAMEMVQGFICNWLEGPNR